MGHCRINGRRANFVRLWRPYGLWFVSLLIAALVAACNPTSDSNAISARDPATLPAPESFQDVQTPITLDNVQNLAYLGRLTQPEAAGTLFNFALSPDGTRLVGISAELMLGWNLVDGSLLFQTSRQEVTRVYYSPDKTEIYGVVPSGIVTVFNADTGAVIDTFEGLPTEVSAAAFDSFDGWLALGAVDGTIKVWDPFTRVSMATINAQNVPVSALAFSADGEQIAATGSDFIRRIDWRDRTVIAERQIGRATVLPQVAFSPAGDWIAVSSDFNAVLWSLSDSSEIIGLETGQGGASQLLMFSPDGRFLLAGNAVNGMTLWDITGGTLAARLPDTVSSRVAAGFDPTASMLITSALDEGVVLWNLRQITSQTLDQAVLDVGTSRIHSVAWTEDGRLLLLFDAGGAVYLWGIPVK